MGKLTKDYNLLERNPELSREWHPTRNGKLRPQDVTPRSTKKVWWICERGHEWVVPVNNRSRGRGCPFCNHPVKERPRFSDWKSAKREIGYGKAIRRVRQTPSGNVLVEMPRQECERFCSLTPPPEELGPAIVQYRKKRDLSQGAFTEIVGHSRNWISAIERDQNIRLSYETYKRIMAVIGG